eukprot:scaffold9159_cov51-Isochrysis_galbana.AAC.1
MRGGAEGVKVGVGGRRQKGTVEGVSMGGRGVRAMQKRARLRGGKGDGDILPVYASKSATTTNTHARACTICPLAPHARDAFESARTRRIHSRACTPPHP